MIEMLYNVMNIFLNKCFLDIKLFCAAQRSKCALVKHKCSHQAAKRVGKKNCLAIILTKPILINLLSSC